VSGPLLDERRDWVLEMSGLTEQRRRLTGELPLGWKQRLALGCAVLHRPPVLFLDEPTSGVDPVSRRNFWDLIYDLSGGGTTIFVSTHYMEEAEYCHRLALMNRGKLIALDEPRALRQRMTEPILELATDNGPAAVQVLHGAPGVVDASLFGRAVHVVVNDAAAASSSLPSLLSSHGIRSNAPTPVAPTLEDVFVSLVRREGGAVAG
jgi:ABC-2 type transport system ATP-binding protein